MSIGAYTTAIHWRHSNRTPVGKIKVRATPAVAH